MEYILFAVAVILGYFCFHYHRLIRKQKQIYQTFLPQRNMPIKLPDHLPILDQYQQFITKCLFLPLPTIHSHMILLGDCQQLGEPVEAKVKALGKDILDYLRRYAEDVLHYLELQDQSSFVESSQQLKIDITLFCKTKFPNLGRFGISLQMENAAKTSIEISDGHNPPCKELILQECAFSSHSIEPINIQKLINIPLQPLDCCPATTDGSSDQPAERSGKKQLTYHIKILDTIIHSRTMEIQQKINILSVIRDQIKS